MAFIKVLYSGMIRRVNVVHPLSWLDLEALIRTTHNIPRTSRLLVAYIDEDGDPISIDSDNELSDFIRDYTKDGKSPKLIVNVRGIDHDSFEIITHTEVNGASAGDNASVKRPLPPYSEPSIDVDTASVHSNPRNIDLQVHSTEDKGEAPSYSAVHVAEDGERAERARQEEEARILAGVEAVKKILEEERGRIEAEDQAFKEAEKESRGETEEAEANRKAEEAYQAFLSQIQPLVDQLISALEANPHLVRRLTTELKATLSQRNFGLLISGSEPNEAGTTGHETCGQFCHRGRFHGCASEHTNKAAVWTHAICNSCDKSLVRGCRYVCSTCGDYDLCHECYARRTEVHDVAHTFEIWTDPNQRWYGVVCDGCNRRNFLGNRFVCLSCDDYDLCTRCHGQLPSIHPVDHEFAKLGDPAARHFSVICDGCHTKGFGGARYKCINCADFDLCVRCYRKGIVSHPQGHKFCKIEVAVSRDDNLVTLPRVAPSPPFASGAATTFTAPVAKEELTKPLESLAQKAGVDPRVDILIDMGFGEDKVKLAEALRRYGSVQRVVEKLLASQM
ncbi:hypothetical protein SeMB42_g04412 [Synchytrium endobioticum]|uniref:ZZ-type domain-containing protein n=1 Tax=Synchytrium endobioticum TaxID=286115 RepID=A0A507CYG1_9FUNG|nr:hypothetical protein SeMB42_g04412 [Synchytrium endobioticum]TPX46032.1 hypothetical protein SeLEV6574_g03478 [Synchytrium endobioticum]